MSIATAWLLDEDDDELWVDVYYSPRPAEPDVGIPRPYAEVDYTATVIEGLGEIIFEVAEEFREDIEYAADEDRRQQ